MSDIRRGGAPRPGWLRSCAAFITVGIALVFIQPVGHAQTDALSFFKNYFITGDYVVGGVGLRGLGGLSGVPGIARGTIAISGVPAKADIVAAFLYWPGGSQKTPGR